MGTGDWIKELSRQKFVSDTLATQKHTACMCVCVCLFMRRYVCYVAFFSCFTMNATYIMCWYSGFSIHIRCYMHSHVNELNTVTYESVSICMKFSIKRINVCYHIIRTFYQSQNLKWIINEWKWNWMVSAQLAYYLHWNLGSSQSIIICDFLIKKVSDNLFTFSLLNLWKNFWDFCFKYFSWIETDGWMQFVQSF